MRNDVQGVIKSAESTGIVPTSELLIGHSYFIPPVELKQEKDSLSWLAQSYKFQILPVLLDYEEQGLLEFGKMDNLPGRSVLNREESLSTLTIEHILEELRIDT